ncbi:RNA ligase family protein [Brevibacillus fulvus]|uniref:DNA ligase (ATP) n=1 Tax=Brevibacillus fulvus TaxID=1125967 RepID=A0A938XXE4_9BACL|nr:RNA ligase family protein [Brevibacillus fulvus]MBM7589460.1 bifunctional non-homologous end joining protein LigD [Brevibacillus fulvus]
MQPIDPMEPIASEVVPHGPEWIAQVKWDGVRVLTYADGLSVRLFNRRQNERTWHYPEITQLGDYCKTNSVILDGEVIALGEDGKPSFHEVMRRDGLRRMEKVSQMQKIVPVTYMIFDLLYLNGEWVIQRSLQERMELLQRMIVPNEQIQLVSSHNDGSALFTVVQQHQLEGIVLKNLTSRYVLGGKDASWRKVKDYRDLIAVVGGVTLRDGIVNSLLLGLYDREGRLHYIGHAGTGKLTQQDWRGLTQTIVPLRQQAMPFYRLPSRHKDAVWLSPQLTVKVQFAEWTASGTLRQPSIQSFVDLPAAECVLE